MNSNKKEKPGFGAGKYVLSALILLLLIGITFYFLFNNFELKDLIHSLKIANFKYYFFAAAMVLLFVWCEGLSYRATLQALGSKLSLFSSFVYGCVNFYFCSITPSATGGQPAVSYYMAKDGISLPSSTFAVLLHTIVYKVVLLIFSILAFIIKFDFISSQPFLLRLLCYFGFAINATIVIFGYLSMRRPKIVKAIVNWCAGLLIKFHILKEKKKVSRGIRNYITEYSEGAKIIKKHPYLPLKIFVIDLIQRTAMFSVAYIVYRSFGFNAFSFTDLFFLQVIISLAVDSLPLPGAVGASEAAFISVYETIYGTSLSAGLLLTRGINFYFLLIFSSIVFFGKYISCVIKAKRRPKL